jgi:hypothetical protein
MIIKSNKYSEVAGALANLRGTVSIQEIIDTILQVSNMKTKTLANMVSNANYENCDHTMKISDLYVDVDYQRTVKLANLIKKLQKLGGFDMYSAGVIDVAIRPSGTKYVWDGARRCILAGLCGHTHIKTTTFVHPMGTKESDCRKQEARYFKSRNADNEKMKPEEIFKSEVVYRDPKALELLELIKNCSLDILGLNPGGKVFGGFVELRNNYERKIDGISEEHFITSSNIIQHVYSNESNVSGYLLCGLAYLLQKNEEVDVSYSVEEIVNSFESYKRYNNKQSDITKHRLNKNARGSIAYLIAKRVLQDNNGLIQTVGLESEEVDILDMAA